MDDLDKYLVDQMKDPEFKREWEASQAEFEFEETEIKANLKESIISSKEVFSRFEKSHLLHKKQQIIANA